LRNGNFLCEIVGKHGAPFFGRLDFSLYSSNRYARKADKTYREERKRNRKTKNEEKRKRAEKSEKDAKNRKQTGLTKKKEEKKKMVH